MNAADKSITITFGELKTITNEDIPIYVSKESALLICQEYLENEKAAEKAQIYGLWVEKLLNAYGITAFTVNEWIQFIKLLKSVYEGIVSDNLKGIDSWLKYSKEFLDWIANQNQQVNFEIFCIFFAFIFESIRGFLQLYRKQSNSKNLDDQLVLFVTLHTSTIKLLGENLLKRILTKSSEFSELRKVLALVCEVGEQQPPLDLKTYIETWKCATKLTSFCFRWKEFDIKSNGEVNTDFEWAKRPMDYLLEEVRRHLRLIYRREAMTQPMEKIKKFLQVTNYYVLLLQKMTGNFYNQHFVPSKGFFEIYCISKGKPAHLTGSQIDFLVDKYVTDHLYLTLQMVCTNANFQESMFNYIHISKPRDFFHLTCDVLVVKIQTYSNGNNLETDMSLCMVLFKELFKDSSVFIDLPKYHKIIEYFASLTILSLDKSPIMKAFLMECIFKENFIVAHAATDVLIIVAHWVTSKHIIPEILFWFDFIRRSPLHPNDPKYVLIKRMMRNVVKTCTTTTEFKAFQSQLVQDNELSLECLKLLQQIGIKSLALNEYGLKHVELKICGATKAIVEDINNKIFTVQRYYKLIAYINLLANMKSSLNSELQTFLYRLTAKIYSKAEGNIIRFSMFLNAYYRFLAQSTHPESKKELQRLLLSLNNSYQSSLPTMQLKELVTYSSNTDNSFTRELAGVFLRNLDTVGGNCLLKELILPPLLEHQSEELLQQNSQIYDKIQFSKTLLNQHICTKIKSIPFAKPPTKRARIEQQHEIHNETLNLYLNEMLEKSKILVNSNIGCLDAKQFAEIKTIIDNLNSLIN